MKYNVEFEKTQAFFASETEETTDWLSKIRLWLKRLGGKKTTFKASFKREITEQIITFKEKKDE